MFLLPHTDSDITEIQMYAYSYSFLRGVAERGFKIRFE